MRLLFFGTPAFAVPTLERMLAGPDRVVGVVTQPDRPRGRGRHVTPSPVAEVAQRAGVPLLRPERVGDREVVTELVRLDADLGVVVAFGQFLPKAVRELPRLGHLINAHASLLPRHRGAAPIAHAILAGDAETGITVMRVDREMDAGPTALVRATRIGDDETTGALERRLAVLAADAIEAVLRLEAEGGVVWSAQDDARATLAPKLGPEDARLDWCEPAPALVRRVRALAPRPGAFGEIGGERLRILAARADGAVTSDPPGTLRIGHAAPRATSHTASGPTSSASPLRIATGAGWLVPLLLQRAGGKPLDAESFARGRPFANGARFGP